MLTNLKIEVLVLRQTHQKKKGVPKNDTPIAFLWSGWCDLNARPQRPERCTLTKLSHIPLREVL